MLSELVADILAEFVDESGDPQVPEIFVTRSAQRAFSLISNDLAVAYVLAEDGTVVPAMPNPHRELWALRIKIMACRYLRAISASRISFSSGDKSMDRSKECSNWAALEKDMTAEYDALALALNPALDGSILRLDLDVARYTIKNHAPHNPADPQYFCEEE